MLRLLVLGAVGTMLALLSTAGIPLAPSAVPALLLFAVAGALIALLFQVAIGLLTAWLGNPAPAYWIWQKLVFVFGGLFLPLTLYPSWIRDIGIATPAAAILFHPASLVLEAGPAALLRVAAVQAFWLVFATLLVALVAAAATRRFVREGV
jgi:ABC-2 type transport system permease protein